MSGPCNLSPAHLDMLRSGSGLSEEVIAARGYKTITDRWELRPLGFTHGQCRTPGLLLPVHCADGSNGLYTYRPDEPRTRVNKRKRNPDGSPKVEIIKYELPPGVGVRLDCPPPCRPMLADPAIPLWITEGLKKADKLATHGLCAIALLGVWNFKGKNEFGATTFLADWDYIALDGRLILIVFDGDVMLKQGVRKALERLNEHLQRKKSHVAPIYLPQPDGQKVGVDDYLLTHSVADLEALIDAPRPKVEPAPPVYELVDAAPARIHKPLSLLGGRAYLAAWPYVKRIETEGLDGDGNIIKFQQPKETVTQRLIVMRDDGVIYGEGGDEPTDKLGMEVCLNETPLADRLLSSAGIRGYRAGQRPPASDVFKRTADVVDRFIDFDHSLADQPSMSELIACYILATWFLDAFNVIGFLWPNGERGSGKTQLLTIVAELSYLGQVVLAGGSYASLRDLADYGATLCFDDAENLSDPQKTDPDKRALLLAGNRKGNSVPVKEPGPDRTWRTRYVNTYCARCFSAIRLPDPILASRTIIIPLVRSADRYRANADPLDYALWPHDRRKLIDDLWALALANLRKIPLYESRVNQQAKLTGRNLEPWRPILAAAAWLEDQGVPGLYERMEAISLAYQGERQEMESTDMTPLVVRAICQCLGLGPEVSEVSEVFPEGHRRFLKTSDITETARQMAEDDELGIDPERIISRRIGRIIKKLRFEKARDSVSRKMGWMVSPAQIQKFASSFGVYSQKKTSETSETSEKAICSTCVQPFDTPSPEPGVCMDCWNRYLRNE